MFICNSEGNKYFTNCKCNNYNCKKLLEHFYESLLTVLLSTTERLMKAGI